jgi:lipopolysaccharide biosynthesis regulator YciM
LKSLHQYTRSTEWFEKVSQIEGETWDVLGNLTYLYAQIKQHEKAIQSAKKLLTYPDAQMEDTKHELYSIIADNYMYQDNITEAISWLDRILAESTNTELVKHTKLVKDDWTTLL